MTPGGAGVSRGAQQVGPERPGHRELHAGGHHPEHDDHHARGERGGLAGRGRPLGAQAAGGDRDGHGDRAGLGDDLALGPEQRAGTYRQRAQPHRARAVEAERVHPEEQPGAGGDQSGQQDEGRPLQAGHRRDGSRQDAEDEQSPAQRRRPPHARPVGGEHLAARAAGHLPPAYRPGAGPRPRRRAAAAPSRTGWRPTWSITTAATTSRAVVQAQRSRTSFAPAMRAGDHGGGGGAVEQLRQVPGRGEQRRRRPRRGRRPARSRRAGRAAAGGRSPPRRAPGRRP